MMGICEPNDRNMGTNDRNMEANDRNMGPTL